MKDPRERHVVCKLERYDLEDRYLRLFDELQALKKHSNAQEDKLKRLATKLVRSGASGQPTDDGERVELLQAENAKLREKLCLLRRQLASGKIFASSPSRPRKLASGPSSAPITCRSESSRLKAPPSCRCRDGRLSKRDAEETESERRTLLGRIAELQAQLASCASGSRREKVAENVEYIRVWRQMKRQNEKFLAARAANELLSEQTRHLKALLEESRRSGERTAAALAAEREQLARLDDSASRVRSSQLELREKDERIADLLGEMAILQQHNRELLELSSKFSGVEQENAELRRSLAEQRTEQELLRDAYDKEKADGSALEAANRQLLTRLRELQTDVDLASVQLAARRERAGAASLKKSGRASEASSSSSEGKPTSEPGSAGPAAPDEARDRAGAEKSARCEKGIQTIEKSELTNEWTQTDESPDGFDSAKISDNAVLQTCDNKSKGQLPQNGNSLSREGMLKLLEQVQISSPLESQTATRVRLTEASSLTRRVSRPVSNLETFLFGDLGL